ncbi:MAG: hypothetical protein ACRDQ7_28210, partial [Haloechinothrix sp.]
MGFGDPAPAHEPEVDVRTRKICRAAVAGVIVLSGLIVPSGIAAGGDAGKATYLVRLADAPLAGYR